MNEEMTDLPQAEIADPDGVQVALRAAQTLWSRGDTSESLKWLRKAAESASDEGADLRSLQLAKAAAELRAKLFGGGDTTRSGAGEVSGAHPIGEHPAGQSARSASHADAEGGRSRSSFPPAAFPGEGADASTGAETAASHSSRPVTATQYPSHRPRQRMGLTSSVPGAPPSPRDAAYGSRENAAYAAVPSWSADAERRVSAAPPPLPLSAIDDYEELEAEPDDEPGEEPGSAWSAAGESWRPQGSEAGATGESSHLGAGSVPPASATLPAAGLSALAASGSAASGGGASVLPPPLPPRGAFSDDEGDFALLNDQATVVMPQEEGEARAAREARWTAASDVWERESRISGWDQDSSSAWAAELRGSSWSGAAGVAPSGANPGVGLPPPEVEVGGVEPPPPSETAPTKLTARVHHQAVRVSFAPDQRVPGQYVVRPLREGEKAATGERIALLVALEPGVPLV